MWFYFFPVAKEGRIVSDYFLTHPISLIVYTGKMFAEWMFLKKDIAFAYTF
jgi:hypothetical protein